MGKFKAHCRKLAGTVQCDQTFTDGAEFQRHMAKVHRVYPVKPDPVLTERAGFRSGPVLSRLATRKPNQDLGELDVLIPDAAETAA